MADYQAMWKDLVMDLEMCIRDSRMPARFPKDGAGCAGRALPAVDGSSTRITGA